MVSDGFRVAVDSFGWFRMVSDGFRWFPVLVVTVSGRCYVIKVFMVADGVMSLSCFYTG